MSAEVIIRHDWTDVTCDCGRMARFTPKCVSVFPELGEVPELGEDEIAADTWGCGACGKSHIMPVIAKSAERP